MASLATQLITVSIIALQRQLTHNNAANREQWNTNYDYIVVGAGSAGAIVAARLTEDPNISVLLLEAGGPATVISDMPAEAWNGMTGENDWGYLTVPQRNAGWAYINNRIVYPRGKVMGGSSTTNYAIYNRGNRLDFDNWANYYGLTEWSYQNVLPYFLRSEHNYNDKYVRNSPQTHSTTGPMAISSPPHPDPILLHYMDAWNNAGVPYTDFNGPNQPGTTLIQQAISPNNWTRSSTTNAFIEPIITSRANSLHVVTRAHVTRLLFNNNTANGLQAAGVEFVRRGQTYSVYARREVILSAGATNTPQILILSGIGPRSHLQDLGIPVQVDLPVGENLQDHILLPTDYLVNNASDIQYSRNIDGILTVQNLYNYYVNNEGPIIQLPVVLTYHSTRGNDNPAWPDSVMATLTDQIGPEVLALIPGMNNQPQWTEYYTPLLNDQRHFYVYYAIYRPRSRGTVRLQSRNPFDAPLIDPAYFTDPYDLAVAVDVLSAGMSMAEGDYFRRYGRIYDRPLPGCAPCTDGRPYYQCYTYLACVAR
ncbi:PREDICTED: L-sorbose 1-dehydrogenase-like, partial [Rhagoletis zephyria]|uniref:L-sorbose 1-dehydrogenase-like n=1 Tax=Rhagoletis zephyria TaxID=28612 RepID=UPI00081195F6